MLLVLRSREKNFVCLFFSLSLLFHLTSPVDFISGPSSVSAPANFSNGSTASLTATCLSTGSFSNPISFRVIPDISSDAYAASGWPTALATKGTVREARGLASMM